MIIINAEIVDLIGKKYFIATDSVGCLHLTKVLIKNRIDFSVRRSTHDYTIQLSDEHTALKFKDKLELFLHKQEVMKAQVIEEITNEVNDRPEKFNDS